MFRVVRLLGRLIKNINIQVILFSSYVIQARGNNSGNIFPVKQVSEFLPLGVPFGLVSSIIHTALLLLLSAGISIFMAHVTNITPIVIFIYVYAFFILIMFAFIWHRYENYRTMAKATIGKEGDQKIAVAKYRSGITLLIQLSFYFVVGSIYAFLIGNHWAWLVLSFILIELWLSISGNLKIVNKTV